MQEREKDIKILMSPDSGLLWPYYKDQKALSSSTLTRILKEIEYGDKQIPDFILQIAANNGKIFHQTIQSFLETGDDKSYLSSKISPKTLEKIKESLVFFKEKKFDKFLGSEKLHHCFYNEDFFGSYIDLEFEDFAIELKTNNIVIDKSPMSMLAFRIQLLIQYLCTKKQIYLLWSTGNGVFFNKFEAKKELFEILEILINIVKNKDIYSFEVKKNIIENLLEAYSDGESLQRLLTKG